MKTYTLPPFTMRFDARQLEALSADTLKRICARWGGRGNEAKALAISCITSGLSSDLAIKHALSAIDPATSAALAIIKEHGGSINAAELESTLVAYGYLVMQEQSYYSRYERNTPTFVCKLLNSGWVLAAPDLPHYNMRDRVDAHELVYTDERILQQVNWPIKVLPLSLSPVTTAPAVTTFRRSQHVTLDLMAVMRALDELNAISLTQSGAIRVSDLRKFRKRLGWQEDESFDGHFFPNIASVVIYAWHIVGWLANDIDALVMTMAPETFARYPLLQQVTMISQAFLGLAQWSELDGMNDYYRQPITLTRSLVFYSLRALPDPEWYYTLEDFLTALYPRIGDYVETTPDYQNPRPWLSGGDNAQFKRNVAAWKEANQAHWVKQERAYVDAMLTSWPYWLGLVEIGTLDDDTLAFRLTALGRMVFSQPFDKPTREIPAPAGEHPAWVVQPNYDLIVYLDASSSLQLAFLERYAERRQTEAHTIHYQLTRDSIYHGLESGEKTIDEILAVLRLGAQTELPQNVERELREWAGQREQITLFTHARLIAFPTPAARTEALAAGLTGTPVGDACVVQTADDEYSSALQQVYRQQHIRAIDYALPLPKCLLAEEDGTLTRTEETADLLLPGQLAHCAEKLNDRRWRITPATLNKLRKAGVTASAMLQTLHARVNGDLPPLLEIAIRNTLGARTPVLAGDAYVLRITDKPLYAAIAGSLTLKPYLLDVPGPDTLVIDPAHIKEFKERLDWLGVKLTPYTANDKRPDWLKTIRDAKTQQRRRGY